MENDLCIFKDPVEHVPKMSKTNLTYTKFNQISFHHILKDIQPKQLGINICSTLTVHINITTK